MDGIIAIRPAQGGAERTYFGAPAAVGGTEALSVYSSASNDTSASTAYGKTGDGVSIAFSEESLTSAKEEKRPGKPKELTEEDKKAVQKLKQRDREVRQHEQTHLAAGGRYVRGGASFSFERGPDGRMYASGGEVSIDVSAARTPEATVQKMQVVRRAALAPANPSPQDRGVAAQASQVESEARVQALKENQKESKAPPVQPAKNNESKPAEAVETSAIGKPGGNTKSSAMEESVENSTRAEKSAGSSRISKGAASVFGGAIASADPFRAGVANSGISGVKRLDMRI